ncbi:MAG: 6,7-dimethyl-8-ribityllumazine synthase [Geminicoccales bacterium]
MSQDIPSDHPVGGRPAGDQPHLLIIEARYYDEIGDMLLTGAERALSEGGATFDQINVPGALEIPAVIRMAIESGQYDAYVALGCVIEGETWHDRIVGGESARGLMDLTLYDGALIGNGILTVHSQEQAKARANPDGGKGKGGDAARAALALLNVKSCLQR